MNTYKKHMLLLSITCLNTIFTIVGMDTPDFEQQQPASNITMALRIGKKIKHKISLDYSSFIFDDSQDKDIKITESNMHPNLTNQSENFVGKYLRPSAYQKCLEDVLSSALKTCNRYGAQKCRLIHFTYTSNLAVLNNDGQHKLQLGAYLSILQKNRFSNISDINFNCLRGNEKSEIMQIITDLSQKKYAGINVHFSKQDDDTFINDDPEKLTALFYATDISPEDALDFLERNLPGEEDEIDDEANQQKAAKERLEQERIAAEMKAQEAERAEQQQKNSLENSKHITQLNNLAEKLKAEREKLSPLIKKYFESKCWSNLSDIILVRIENSITEAQNKRNNDRFLAYGIEDIIIIQKDLEAFVNRTNTLILERQVTDLETQFNDIKDGNYDTISNEISALAKAINQYQDTQNYSEDITNTIASIRNTLGSMENRISQKKTQPQSIPPTAPEVDKSTPKKAMSWGAYFKQNPLATATFSFVSLATLTTAGLYWLDKLPPSVTDLLSSLWKNIPSMPSLSDLWNGNSKLPETVTT